MDNIELLKNWMNQNGYSNSLLAQKLECSYELVYKITSGVRPITNNFRWRFAQVFGWEVASELFDQPTAEPEPAIEPEPQPEAVLETA